VAFSAADDTPWVVVDDRQILRPAWLEGVVEVLAISGRLLPGVFWIAKKHTQQMASAWPTVVATITRASMHDAQVVDELDVALFAIEFGAETLCKLLDSMHSMQLLVGYRRHTGVAEDQRRSKKRSFD
jgi:hypothetical protein